jgi:hypothetical protein
MPRIRWWLVPLFIGAISTTIYTVLQLPIGSWKWFLAIAALVAQMVATVIEFGPAIAAKREMRRRDSKN